MSHPFDVAELAATYASKSPQDILKLAFQHFGDELWISFSGAEDVVLVDMAWKLNKNVKVFSLDTGRLHPETYRFIEQVREHYNLQIELISPDQRLLEPFVKEKGLFSFYKDGHGECCGVRKIEPLRRKLAGVKAWATGQRRGCSFAWTCCPGLLLSTLHKNKRPAVPPRSPRKRRWPSGAGCLSLTLAVLPTNRAKSAAVRSGRSRPGELTSRLYCA